MPYSNFSPNFKIPFNVSGEQSSGQSNRRAALIIDNQLTASAVLTGDNGVIQEGDYTATFSTGSSTVSLLATGTNYAMQAMIEGVYIQQNTTLAWTVIPDSTTAYLYVITEESNLYTSGEFSSLQNRTCKTMFNTSGITPPNSLLVGVAVTTTSAISLNTTATASDSSGFSSGKPLMFSYPDHRLQTPMDHPAGSVVSSHLAADLSMSGLTVQTALTLSGVALYNQDNPTSPSELVTLKVLQKGVGSNVVTKTTTYAAQVGDLILADTTAAFTITLPSVSGLVQPAKIRVKKISSDGNAVTISCSDGIDGGTSVDIVTQWSGISLFATGTKWLII